MKLEEIRELIRVVTETGVAELEVQRGDDRVRIRRILEARQPELVYAAPAMMSAQVPAAHTHTAPPPPPAAQPAETASEPMLDPSIVIVKSPIVGTFYEAPAPGAASFVKIGDTVQPGKVLCIIESMKLMNEIEAEMAGTVVSRLATNGQAVEYGEALFAIKPL